MRNLMLMMVVGLVGCGSPESDACKTDTDCKGERVCTDGECVDPTSTDRDDDQGDSESPDGREGNSGGDTPNPGTDNSSWGNNDWGNNDWDDEGNAGGEIELDDGGGDTGSQSDIGQTCQFSDECDDLCILASGDDYGYCTITCDDFTDCPDFWQCKQAVQNASGKYCIE